MAPTSAPWLNAVEDFFAKLTRRRVKCGIFHLSIDLLAAINRNLAEYNHNPNSFVWTSNPDHIIAPAIRGYKVVASFHSEIKAADIRRCQKTEPTLTTKLRKAVGPYQDCMRGSTPYCSRR